MTYQDTAATPRRSRQKRGQFEYGVYFAIIFLIALPISLVRCLASLVWKDPHKPRRDFISCAWREAQIVTPMIFSA
ncbi:MAG: cytochrome PufQ [Pseudomonadota bacterium]